jgi:hypothetical protein
MFTAFVLHPSDPHTFAETETGRLPVKQAGEFTVMSVNAVPAVETKVVAGLADVRNAPPLAPKYTVEPGTAPVM